MKRPWYINRAFWLPVNGGLAVINALFFAAFGDTLHALASIACLLAFVIWLPKG